MRVCVCVCVCVFGPGCWLGGRDTYKEWFVRRNDLLVSIVKGHGDSHRIRRWKSIHRHIHQSPVNSILDRCIIGKNTARAVYNMYCNNTPKEFSTKKKKSPLNRNKEHSTARDVDAPVHVTGASAHYLAIMRRVGRRRRPSAASPLSATTQRRTLTHVCVTRTPQHTLAYTHTRTHSLTYSLTFKLTHSPLHTLTVTLTHTYIHTHIHTNTHTYIYIREKAVACRAVPTCHGSSPSHAALTRPVTAAQLSCSCCVSDSGIGSRSILF